MRNILLTIIICLAASAVLFVVGTLFGLPAEIIKGLAGLPAIGIKNIYELLEARKAKQQIARAESHGFATIKGFSLNVYVLFGLSTITFLGLANVTNGVSGLMTGFAEGYLQAVSHGSITINQVLASLIIAMNAIPLAILVQIYVGRWIGTRAESTRSALLITIGALVVGLSAGLLATLLFIPDAIFESTSGQVRTPTAVATILAQSIPINILYGVSCLAGVFWGRKIRVARYFSYLLNLLPNDERVAIVTLAREEAIKISRSSIEAR